MPCRTDFQDDYPTKGMVNREALDTVTRVACSLANAFEKLIQNEVDSYYWDSDALTWALDSNHIDTETYNWIIEHRAADEQRKARLKESALSKLTAEEREALGL